MVSEVSIGYLLWLQKDSTWRSYYPCVGFENTWLVTPCTDREFWIQYRSSWLTLGLLFFSHPAVSDSLRPHGLQHTRPPRSSPSPEVCPVSCPLHQWCHPAISSSDTLFSFCPQSFPASGTFPVSWQFVSDDQNTGALALAIRPYNEHSGLISLKTDWFDLHAVQHTFRSLLQHHSLKASILWCSAFFIVQLTTVHDHWENHSLDYIDLCRQSSVWFSTHCLGLSWCSSQEAITFWFHGCSHHLQWF